MKPVLNVTDLDSSSCVIFKFKALEKMVEKRK